VKQAGRLKYGKCLTIDQSLTSNNGQYTLTMQVNANFCITKKSAGSKIFTSAAKNITRAQLICFDRVSNDLMVYNKYGKQTQREGNVLWKARNTNSFMWNVPRSSYCKTIGNTVLYLMGDAVWLAKNSLVPTPTTAPAPKPVPTSGASTAELPTLTAGIGASVRDKLSSIGKH
jgi:hypothetical protein